jgi:hypothetical protein
MSSTKSSHCAIAGTRSTTMGEWYDVYCFSDPADANKFKEQFGGEKFNPNQRGKGRHWARRNKPHAPYTYLMCEHVRLSSDYSTARESPWLQVP